MDADIVTGIVAVAAIAAAAWLGPKLTVWQSRRVHSLAWMFLTFDDENMAKMRAEWMKEPNKFITELEAMRLSREMRAKLRSEALDRRT